MAPQDRDNKSKAMYHKLCDQHTIKPFHHFSRQHRTTVKANFSYFLLDICVRRFEKLFDFASQVSAHLRGTYSTHCTQRQAHDILSLMV